MLRQIKKLTAPLFVAATILLGLPLRAQTISSFPWQQNFNYATVLDSNWTVSNGWLASQRYSYGWGTYQGGAYIITPAIQVPSSGLDHLAFWVGANESFDLLVDTAAGTNIADFTDTLLSWRRVGANYRQVHAAPLAPFAGQTIRLAMVKNNNNQGFTLKWMRIDQDTLPVIEVTKPSVVITDREALFNAVLVHGAADNISYTWHSSLMGTTVSTSSSQYAITYTLGGTDTLTTIATNAFGSDTVVTTVNAIHCPDITTFPWTENFDNSIHCWLPLDGSDWRGTTTHGMPDMGSLMFSQSAVGIDSWIATRAIHVPSDADDSLLLSWDAYSTNVPSSFHHNYYILATTGNYDDTTAYDTLYHSSPNYTWPIWPNHFSGSVPIGQYAGQTIHIAFRNHCLANSTSTMGLQDLLFIDNVKIYSSKPPLFSMPATGQASVDDTTFFEAYLQQGSASGLTFSWHSSLLGNTVVTTTPIATMVYPFTGVDTLTIIAANSYGSDTAVMVVRVSYCSVQPFPWYETFSTASSVDCWHGDWQWQSYGGGRVQSVTGRFASPLLVVPLDAVGLRLKWNKSTSGAYRVLVSPSGGYLASDFTDTLYSGNESGALMASLNAYAGQQIRIAFEKTTSSNLRIEAVELDYNQTPPTATLSASALQVRTFDTLTVTAALNACSPRSFADSWHSSLLGTTVATGPVATIVYNVEGIDTITYTVSNQYGTDTQQVVVQVVYCGPRPLPFGEDFNSITEDLPRCWDAVWEGLDANAPHVALSGIGSPDNTEALIVNAGVYDGYDTVAYIILPGFADTLKKLSVSFWYAFENETKGALTVGYIEDNVFVPVSDVTPARYNASSGMYGRRDTVSFSTICGEDTLCPSDARIALRWSCNVVWYGVAIDDLSVWYTDCPTCSSDTLWRTVTVNAVMDVGHYDGLDEMVHGAGTYADGSTVTLEGEVHGGSIGLFYWLTPEGDTIYNNPYTFVIHSDVILTAVFVISGGIGEVDGTTFTLYPNPASMTVTVETDQPSTLTLTDATGRECGRWTVAVGKTTLDISTLPVGVYFVHPVGSSIIRKLIVR